MKVYEILEANAAFNMLHGLEPGIEKSALRAIGKDGVRSIEKDSDAAVINAVKPQQASKLPKAVSLVGGNNLYHATDAAGLRGILSSGTIRAAIGPQTATAFQTARPTVSVTRDWNYAIGHGAQAQEASIGRDAIIVMDRSRLEQSYRTLATSQGQDVRGLAAPGIEPYKVKIQRNKVAYNKNSPDTDVRNRYTAPHYGGESEEAVVVPKGSLPTDSMVGFYVNPKSSLVSDPAVMADPRRLELAPGGTGRFVLANS